PPRSCASSQTTSRSCARGKGRFRSERCRAFASAGSASRSSYVQLELLECVTGDGAPRCIEVLPRIDTPPHTIHDIVDAPARRVRRRLKLAPKDRSRDGGLFAGSYGV